MTPLADHEREVVIGGTTYRLCYDMAAFRRLERETGISILGAGIVGADFEDLSRSQAILWCGLLRHAPELTLTALDAMVLPRDVPRIRAVVEEALRASTQEDHGDGDATEGPPGAQGLAGGSSGPSVGMTSD